MIPVIAGAFLAAAAAMETVSAPKWTSVRLAELAERFRAWNHERSMSLARAAAEDPEDWDAVGPLYYEAIMDLRGWELDIGREFGLPVLGIGGARVVFRLDEDRVLKLPYGADSSEGTDFNQYEMQLFQNASPTLLEWLVPVLDADPDGEWLIMAFAEDVKQVPGHVVQALRAMPDAPKDLIFENFGLFNGRVMLRDYAPPPLWGGRA
jgi:hypothetical protein